MRTSETIMSTLPSRSTSNARSPEETGTVLNPWLFRNESRRLRWPASSSTMRMRGGCRLLLTGSGGMSGRLRGQLQMGNSDHGPFRLVGGTFDFPTVRQDNLLDHRQAEPGAFLVGREVGLEYVGAVVGGDTRAVVTDFQ